MKQGEALLRMDEGGRMRSDTLVTPWRVGVLGLGQAGLFYVE